MRIQCSSSAAVLLRTGAMKISPIEYFVPREKCDPALVWGEPALKQTVLVICEKRRPLPGPQI